MTTPTAEQLALRGLLLLVVEVQNLARARGEESGERIARLLGARDEIQNLVESEHATEMVQLARAALELTPVTVFTVREFIGFLSGHVPELHQVEVPRLGEAWEEFRRRSAVAHAAIPASQAGVHN